MMLEVQQEDAYRKLIHNRVARDDEMLNQAEDLTLQVRAHQGCNCKSRIPKFQQHGEVIGLVDWCILVRLAIKMEEVS